MQAPATPTPAAVSQQGEAADTLVLGAEHRDPPAPPPAEPPQLPFGPGRRPLTEAERTTFYRLLHPDFSSLDSNRDPINAVKYLDPDHEKERPLVNRVKDGMPSALPTLHETAGGIAKSIELLRDLMRQGDPGSEFRGKTLEQRIQRALDEVADWRTRANEGYTEDRVPAQLGQAHDDLSLLLQHARLRTLQRERQLPGLDSLVDASLLALMRPAGFNAEADALVPHLHSIADELEAVCRAGSSGHRPDLQAAMRPSQGELAHMQKSIRRLHRGVSGDAAREALRRVHQALALVRGDRRQADELWHHPSPHNRTVASIRLSLDTRAARRPADGADAAQFRLQHGAYASLARVLTDTGLDAAAQNAAIASLAMRSPLPANDPRRIEFARIASLFLRGEHTASHEKAKLDVCQSVLQRPPGQQIRRAEIEGVLPDAPDRMTLLVDALPRFIGPLNAAERTACVARVHELQGAHGSDRQWRNAGPIAERLAGSFTELERVGRPLQAWRDGANARGRSLRDAVDDCLRHGLRQDENVDVRQALGVHLLEMASDLPALRGRRKQLVETLEHLSNIDSRQRASGSPERVLATEQRNRILEALIAQQPDPRFGDTTTQNMIIELLRREFENNLLPREMGVARLAQLATVMPELPADSVLNTRNPQGVAAKLIDDAVRVVAPRDAAPILQAVLRSVGLASSRRSAPSGFPTTMAGVFRESGGLALLAIGTAGLGLLPAIGNAIKGSPSPQQRLALGVGDYLMDHLGNRQLSPREMDALLPVVHQILNSRTLPNNEEGNRLERHLQARTLMALCRGGLPLSVDEAGRSRLLNAAIGTNPEVRQQVARALTDLCARKHEGVDSTTRMGAARLLLALDRDTASFPESVRSAARQAFQAAVRDAGRSGNTEPKEAGFNLAILREATGDRSSWLPDGLKQGLTRSTVKALHRLPPAAAAELMPLVVENLPQDQYGRLGRRLAKYSAQDLPPVMLALVGALGRFQGQDPGPLVDAVIDAGAWGRLPETMRATALVQHLPIALSEAGPAGRRAILAFIERLGGARRADAACALLKTLADGDVLAAWDAEQQHPNDAATHPDGTAAEQVERALDQCLDALRRDPDALRSVAKEAAERAGSLPDTVLPRFIPHARLLQPAQLRPLMCAWLNDLRFKAPEDAGNELQAWAQQARAAAPGPLRSVMQTLLFLAQQAHADPAARPRAESFQPDVNVLREAMPELAPEQAAVAARRLAKAGAFGSATVTAMVGKLPGIRDEQARTALLRLCYGADQAATLLALGGGWGQAQARPDGSGADRPNLQQAVPVSDTETATLQHLLDTEPAAMVAPALSAMAKQVGGLLVPPHFIREFGAALDRFMRRPDATAPQRASVLTELVRPTVDRGTADQVPGEEAIRAMVDRHAPALGSSVPQQVRDFNAIMANAGQQDARAR